MVESFVFEMLLLSLLGFGEDYVENTRKPTALEAAYLDVWEGCYSLLGQDNKIKLMDMPIIDGHLIERQMYPFKYGAIFLPDGKDP